MESMSGRERIMTALFNRQPDRVPATPDISIMIPTKLTGKPNYEVEVEGNPSLTSAYIHAARFFGLDGWMFNGTLSFKTASQVWWENETAKFSDRWVVRSILHTPDGDLTSLSIYPYNNPGTVVEKLVKDFKADFKKIRHLYAPVVSYDDAIYRAQKQEIGDIGMICCYIDPPGFQNYFGWIGLDQLTYAVNDYPELFDELVALHEKQAVQKMEMAADARVESILTGGSGSITLQSPALFRRLSLPTIKAITAIAKQANILTGIHSCGKEYAVVESCANETDLNYINPLEVPPMGDCHLADVKRKFGHKLALMGNLHTSEVMLFGSVDTVRLEALRAIRDAGQGGGFVLSTGDQCGRDTPFENIFALVRVAKEYGQYPLDTDRVNTEIKRLEQNGVKGASGNEEYKPPQQ
ncbi:MAG: uroporphyrinogen decarboxylase family protein [Anaerolineae bacterium]